MKRSAWGKTEAASGRFHPLPHHSMDVAAVFMRMLELPVIRSRLHNAAGAAMDSGLCQRLAALVFLHDVGKLHPGFQAKGWPAGLWRRPLCGHVEEGCRFFILACRRLDHPFAATMRQIDAWGDAVESLLEGILAHHGRPAKEPGEPSQRSWKSLPHYDWQEQARVMDDALQRWFAGAFESQCPPLPDEPRSHHSGTVRDPIVRDWWHWPTGSDQTVFDPGALPERKAPTFVQITGYARPHSAQAVVGNVAQDARLLVLEAETGSGKTESALWRFMQLFAAGAVSGMYFAVPTPAYGADAPEAVLAIPGMVRAGEASGRVLPDWNVLWEDRPSPIPARWAAEHATRFLAATAAVGTVDQAMLAALQVKHAHLRGSALRRSLLVIDEVHASDAYMTAVIEILLREHLAIGALRDRKLRVCSSAMVLIRRSMWPILDASARTRRTTARSKTSNLVRQEVDGLMLAYYAVRRLIHTAVRHADEDPDRPIVRACRPGGAPPGSEAWRFPSRPSPPSRSG